MKIQKQFRAIALVFCICVAGCGTVPGGNKIIDRIAATAPPAKIVGPAGPLTDAESKAVLDGMGISSELQRQLAIEQAVGSGPLIAGNHTRLLRDGAQTFPAIFSAIKGARNHINLEYFILEDIQSGGVRLSDLLVRKQRQGVSVNIIYDSFGSSDTGAAFFNRLKDAGVQMVKFNPINPLEMHGNGYLPNDRDHRKILAVDGSTGIVGGVNLSTTYQEHPSGKSMGPQGSLPSQWRDTDLEIKGPAVAELEELFLRHWSEQKGPRLNQGRFFPKLPDKGTEIVRIIGSAPAKTVPRYYLTLLSAIRHARANVWLMTAYFVPTHEEKENLTAAARRGVDVRILVPSVSDSRMSLALQHSSYSDLLEAGVKIYEVRGEVLHSKTAVIDGVWSAIGSSNLDFRSVVFNDEVDAVVLGKKTGREMEEMYKEDLKKATPITGRKWKSRAFPRRLYEIYAHLWQAML
jgi:cardiolipin synthase A/B